MNDEAVCRTAPATPGLSKIGLVISLRMKNTITHIHRRFLETEST